MSDPNDLLSRYGPWAMVTGAASGLGAEFAVQIAQAGLHLVLVDRDEERLSEHGETLRRRAAVEVRTIVLDLSREDFLDDLLPRIEGLSIRLLVNNAGIAKVGAFLAQDRRFLIDQLHVNARAALLLTHSLGNRMKASGGGGIIVVSSGAAWAGSALNANYAATKAYDLILAESLWAELGEHGIDVLGFMPTSTDTPGLWRETPAHPRFMVMSSEDAVQEALGALGRTPSLFAGRANRTIHRAMRSLLPRRALIRLSSWAMRSFSQER